MIGNSEGGLNSESFFTMAHIFKRNGAKPQFRASFFLVGNNEDSTDVSLGLKRLHYHACFNKQVLFEKRNVQIY